MAEREKQITNAAWIKECEERFSQRFFDIARDITERRHLRIIRLFGPTCSGKTTSAQILISLFESFGKRAHVISIDDFFYDKEVLLERSRRLGLEGIDYDSPETIDCEALRSFEQEIFSSAEPHEVHCPVFDFSVGRCTGFKTTVVDDDDIFIFEGIQAIYKNVIDVLSRHGSASIYIAPLEPVVSGDQIFKPNELRFMRRLVRDYHFRNSSPEFTYMLWESVRENEDKNIFPYVGNSDYFVSSSMAYEIGVLKPYLCEIIGKMDKNDEHYAHAQNILNKIEKTEEISSKLILPGMLYCEFV